MLSELKIENVAVIEKAQVHFDQGFNVLTGETGAGKSILIDSIQAIMGSRVSRDLVRTGARKACIWATFEQIPERVKRQLEKAGYEAEDSLLLYREISAEGKSSCRLNGMPVTAAVVRDICGGLVSIHGQHDSHALTNPARHLAQLDAYAQNQSAHAAYYQVYRQLVAVKREADALAMDEAQRRQRMDYLRFQVDEIENAQLDPEEETRLQARRKVVTNAQDLLEALSRAHSALSGGDEEGGAADLLGEASNSLESAAQLDESLADVSEQLSSLYYTARELTGELASRLEGYSFDAGELDEIEGRLDELYRLKHKYGPTVADVIACGEKARQELESMEHSTERLEELEQQKGRIRLIALLDTLEYLKKGGRISGAAAAVGAVLSIKPVIAIEDGEVVVLGKARGSKNGNNMIKQLIQKEGGINFDMPYTLAYSGLSDDLLKKYIKDSAELYEGHADELPISTIGCAIGTHVGPGAIAAAFFAL